MNLRDKIISSLETQIEESKKKLKYISGSEKTKELYHNGNLHFLLRKAIYTFGNKKRKRRDKSGI